MEKDKQLDELRAATLKVILSERNKWPDTDITLLADIDSAMEKLQRLGRLVSKKSTKSTK